MTIWLISTFTNSEHTLITSSESAGKAYDAMRHNLEEKSDHDLEEYVEVTLEDLLIKVTSNWNIKSRGRKTTTSTTNKRGRPTKNKTNGDKLK